MNSEIFQSMVILNIEYGGGHISSAEHLTEKPGTILT